MLGSLTDLDMACRDRVIKLLGWVMLALVLIPASKAWYSTYGCEARDSAVGWQDEGYVLAPAMRVYREGYSQFRCREINPTLCYGSSSAFIDAWTLKVLPQSWVERDPILEVPGTHWFFNSPFPNAMRALRLSRVWSGIAVLVVLIFLAVRSGVPFSYSASIALALSLDHPFLLSCRGLKNDYPSILVMLSFLIFARNNSKYPSLSKDLALSFLGVLGLGYKFSLLIPLVFWLGHLVWSQEFRRAAVSALACLAFYVALNPNLFVSLSEASWFLIFTSMVEKRTDFEILWKEFTLGVLRFGIPSLLILAIARKNWKGPGRNAWMLLVPLVWAVSNVKAGWLRAPYYLPYQVWLLVLSLWVYRDLRDRKKGALGILAAILFVSLPTWNAWKYGHYPIGYSLTGVPDKPPAHLEQWINHPERRNKNLLVDATLRPAIRQGSSRGKVAWFDQLSEAPSKVLSHLQGESETVVVACLKETSKFPAAVAWEKLTEKLGVCMERESLNQDLIYSFENGRAPKYFAEISKVRFLGSVEKSQKLSDEKLQSLTLSPRALKGALCGIDYWYSPLVLYRNCTLEGQVRLPKEVDQLSISLESNCKNEDAKVLVSISGNNGKSPKNEFLLKIPETQNFIQKTLGRWWNKRVVLPPMTMGFEKSDLVEIKIEAVGLSEPRCRAALGEITFR